MRRVYILNPLNINIILYHYLVHCFQCFFYIAIEINIFVQAVHHQYFKWFMLLCKNSNTKWCYRFWLLCVNYTFFFLLSSFHFHQILVFNLHHFFFSRFTSFLQSYSMFQINDEIAFIEIVAAQRQKHKHKSHNHISFDIRHGMKDR